jgi:hypothetical protein
MVQVVELTKDEQIALYMKSTKAELASMLYECNRILKMRTTPAIYAKSFNSWQPNCVAPSSETSNLCTVIKKRKYNKDGTKRKQ